MHKLIVTGTLLLSACSIAPAQVAPPVPPPGAMCSNDALARFVGQPASVEIGSQMLASSGARVLRWVTPDMMVTMEYRVDRLTVRLGTDNRIGSLGCG